MTSLVVQWLRLLIPKAGGRGSISGQGTRSHIMLQLKILHATTKISNPKYWKKQILGAATKTWCSQINKYFLKKKKKKAVHYILGNKGVCPVSPKSVTHILGLPSTVLRPTQESSVSHRVPGPCGLPSMARPPLPEGVSDMLSVSLTRGGRISHEIIGAILAAHWNL